MRDIEIKADDDKTSNLEDYLLRQQVQELLVNVCNQISGGSSNEVNNFDLLRKEYKKYKEKSKRNDDIDGTKNAFNQKSASGYHYQNHDLLRIQKQLLKSYPNFVQCNPIRVGIDTYTKQAQQELVDAIQDKSKKQFLGIFNPTGNHWTAFYIFKQDKSLTILYKDSQGNNADAFLQILNSLLPEYKITTHTHNGYEQTSGVECGIFALKNMQIMAEQLTSNHNHFITQETFKNYKAFCTLEAAQKIRVGDSNLHNSDNFPKLYKEQVTIEETADIINVKLRNKIIMHHFNEINTLVQLLNSKKSEIKNNLSGITFQIINIEEDSITLLKANTQNRIYVELSAPANLDDSNYEYGYRFYLSEDLHGSKEEVISHIQQSLNGVVLKPLQGALIKYEVTANNCQAINKIPSLNLQKEREELESNIKNEDSDLYNTLKIQLKDAHVLSGSEEHRESHNIDWINPSFGEYTLEALDYILDLRLNDLKLNNIKTLQGIYIDQDDNNITDLLAQILSSITKTTLVPLNLFNKHAVGLVFEKSKDTVNTIKYFDSLNKPIPQELKQLITSTLGVNVNFEEIIVEQQNYANCGAEVIENFIQYLTGKRVSQEKAIELHQKLGANQLENIDQKGVYLEFKELDNNYRFTENCSEQSQYRDTLYHNFDYGNHQHVEVAGEIHSFH